MARLQPPPLTQTVLGPDNKPTPAWRDWFTQAQRGVDLAAAPADGTYLTTTANSDLTADVNLGLLASGWLRITVALGIATVHSSLPVVSQSSPANPTGTASTAGVMMGLAGAITPAVTGRVQIILTGTIFNATAIADGANVQLRTGTGSAPANGDALSGTAAGGLVKYVAATTAERAPFACSAIVSGLALSTAIWIDVGLAATVGGTATITDLSLSAVEV